MAKKNVKVKLTADSVDKNTGNISLGGQVFNNGKLTGNIKI